MASSPLLTIRHAALLGLIHGPAELLPISSSGHIALIPWLARWPSAELDPALRKSFEVALHAGTAAALLIALRTEVKSAVADLDRRRIALILLSTLPPAALAVAFEGQIERNLGTPGTVATGLVIGSAAMLIADCAPQERRREDAGAIDALALGLGQAAALMPGISRNGATLVAARMRRFCREDANALSRHAALPIITAATVLKGSRLARSGLQRDLRAPFAVGVGASFASTVASTWLIGRVERDRSLVPYALYRFALAGLVVRQLRKDRQR